MFATFAALLLAQAAPASPPLASSQQWTLADRSFGEDFFVGDLWGSPAVGVDIETPALGPVALFFRLGATPTFFGTSTAEALPGDDLEFGLRLSLPARTAPPLRGYFDLSGGVVNWSGAPLGNSSPSDWVGTFAVGLQALTGAPAPGSALSTLFFEIDVSALGVPAGLGSTSYPFGAKAPLTIGFGALVGLHVPN